LTREIAGTIGGAAWAAHVPVTWDYSSTEEEPVMTVLVPMTVEQDEDGWWCAHAQLGPNVGANGQGQTRKEALDDLREAILASFEADGGIPEWLVRSESLAVDVDEVA
jgi:predicted RNase H-like HicB family nuclease